MERRASDRDGRATARVTSPDDIAATVRAFFDAVGGAGLELPDGWFGRPYDNVHALRSVDVVAGDLVVGLDELQTLTVHAPGTAEVDGRTLTLGGCGGATWEWTAYGSDPPRRQRRTVPPGAIRFHG
jgi:hypothetical protein